MLFRGCAMSDPEDKKPQIPKFNILPKIAISVTASIGWLIFLIVWLYFIAENFSVYQNLAVFLLSVLILGIINSVIWIPFGIMRKK
jgi:hypothetical protein